MNELYVATDGRLTKVGVSYNAERRCYGLNLRLVFRRHVGRGFHGQAERIAHILLGRHRVSGIKSLYGGEQREWFSCSTDEAASAVKTAIWLMYFYDRQHRRWLNEEGPLVISPLRALKKYWVPA